VGFMMLDFTWRIFTETGNIDTYLLFKEMDVEKQERAEQSYEELANIDFPVS
jgi:YqzL-like protein